jgi:hypothetical protein
MMSTTGSGECFEFFMTEVASDRCDRHAARSRRREPFRQAREDLGLRCGSIPGQIFEERRRIGMNNS